MLGGLGGAVAEWVAEHAPCRVVRHGVQDEFGESGEPAELYAKHGLDAAGIVAKAQQILS